MPRQTAGSSEVRPPGPLTPLAESRERPMLVEGLRWQTKKGRALVSTVTKPDLAEGPELRGIFPPHRAGALAGVSGNRIGQWARRRLIRPSYYEGRPANLYSFYDVAEAIVVHWLYARGFDYDRIHQAIAGARKDHPSWPLLRAPLGVAQHAVTGDPRGAIVLERDKGVFVDTAARGDQITLPPEMLEDFAMMLRRGGWFAQELGLERIEVDPRKMGGIPSIRGRRWPLERVAQLATDEQGRVILIEDYGLDDRDIEESVAWVSAVARAR
jgi:uncharacterized protein (DUF433 family)